VSATVIDGKAMAAEIRREVAQRVRALVARGKTPGLAAVLVGNDEPSRIYVGAKEKACAEVGIRSERHELPADVPEEELLGLIRKLNEDPAVHGILVQLPLPDHIPVLAVHETISVDKDVDGLTPNSVGRLVRGEAAYLPATPYGILELLSRTGIETKGAQAVVVGRSNIVGRPMANLLIQDGPGGNATVTVCHSRTRDIKSVTRLADLLIVAMGKPEFVTGEMIKPGAVVIDVGVNRVDDPTLKQGYRLVGDVNFAEAKKVASAITPVPGGVGPMTITMLLYNTVQAARQWAQA